MQVPKFRCTDKLYVQLTYFHCTAFRIKNQPFASNVLTAASMPAVCRRDRPTTSPRAVPAAATTGVVSIARHSACQHAPPATSPRAVPARKYVDSLPPPRPQGRFPSPDRARASTRPPRPRRGTLPPRPPRPRRGTLPPRPPRPRSRPCPPVSMPAAFQCRDHKAGSFCLTERVPARAPRDPGVGRAY